MTGGSSLWRVRLSIWAAVAALLLLAGGAVVLRGITAQQTSKEVLVGEANVRSKFSLTNHNGEPVTEASLGSEQEQSEIVR